MSKLDLKRSEGGVGDSAKRRYRPSLSIFRAFATPRKLLGDAGLERWRGLPPLTRLGFRLQFLTTVPLIRFTQMLPERSARALGAALGRLAYYLLPGRRKIGLRNLAVAFPEYSDKQRRRVLARSFRAAGQTVAEVVQLIGMSDDELRRRVRYAPGCLELLPRNGRGVIFVSGHIGNWELLALAHSLHVSAMHLVARRLDNPIYNDVLQALRSRGGSVILERHRNGTEVHQLLSSLNRGGTVGILVDQYPHRRFGIEVPFFDKMALAHRGPAALAIRAGVSLVPSFLRRDENKPGHYVIHVATPVTIEGPGDTQEKIRSVTTKLQQALEQEISARPEDWLWMHRRWKGTADGEAIYGDLNGARQRRRAANAARRQRHA